MQRILMVFCVMTISATSIKAQGSFQNLDFEAAQIVYANSGHVDIIASNALPGWSAFSGTVQLSTIVFGATGLIFPVNLTAQTNGGSVSGNFSLVLGKGGSQAGSISQTGLVPVGTQSLLFKIGTRFSEPLTVSLGGQGLSYIALANTQNYILYGADVSSFRGQTAALAFTSLGGITMLDGIQFSSQPIPEPSALIFLAGGVFLSGLVWSWRSRQIELDRIEHSR